MASKNNGLKKLFRSFSFAFSGIIELVKSEQNARIHLLATICVVIAGFVFDISGSEWCVVIILVALIWASEAFNTAIEKLTDHLFHEYNETARIVKDISAGAVFICAIAAVLCAAIIFLPKIFALF